MALRATLIATGQDIELDNGDQATLELLESLRGDCPRGVIECREHDGLPELAHRQDENGRVHGAWLYVRRLGHNVLLLCHNGYNDPELRSKSCGLRVGMSDQHRLERDSLCDIGERVGFTMNAEHPIRGERGSVVARLDVHGIADEREFGVEVQLSAMKATTAKSRDKKALKAGVPLVWTAKRADAAWARKNPIANVATNDLDRRASIDTWRIVSGLRTFTYRPCFEFPRCPTTQTSRDCGSRHVLWRAVVGDGELRVADFLERYGDGRIVRLDTGTRQGVVPVPAAKAREWSELNPIEAAASDRDQRLDRPTRRLCGYTKVDQLPMPRTGVTSPWSDAAPTNWAGPRDTPATIAAYREWAPGLAPKFTCPTCGDPSVELMHPTCDSDHADWYLDQQMRPPAEPCTTNPGLCGSCRGGPCSSGQPEADQDPLLALPQTTRAAWWSVCPGCGWRINERSVVGLRDVSGGARGWACRRCLAPELDAGVPAPRAAGTAGVPA